MQEQANRGLTFKGATTTYRDFLETWLNSAQTVLKPKTVEQYRQITRDHIVPELGRLKLKDIRPDQIQSLYNRKNQELSTYMVRLIHAVVHRSLNQAFQWGLIPRNPAAIVIKPRVRRREFKTLSDGQIRSLLSVVEGTKYLALYYLAATTGLRMGELLGLKWSDLDWLTGILSIQRQLQRTDQGIGFSEPKTKSSKRRVLLGAGALDRLRAHLELQNLERQFTSRWKDQDMMFPSSVGTPLEPRSLQRFFKLHLAKAGLPDIRFHDLRHTAATLMLQQGVHPKVVQERLGHSSITMTLDIYSHVLPDMQSEAADKMDDLLKTIPFPTSDRVSMEKV